MKNGIKIKKTYPCLKLLHFMCCVLWAKQTERRSMYFREVANDSIALMTWPTPQTHIGSCLNCKGQRGFLSIKMNSTGFGQDPNFYNYIYQRMNRKKTCIYIIIIYIYIRIYILYIYMYFESRKSTHTILVKTCKSPYINWSTSSVPGQTSTLGDWRFFVFGATDS